MEEVRVAIELLNNEFTEYVKEWEGYFAPTMRPWLQRLLLGLNIDTSTQYS